MLTLAFNTKPLKAGGTIYIRPDGSVDPQDAPIGRDKDIYTLTGDIYQSIIVERSNITLDGNGHMLIGQGKESGLSFGSRISNVTIQNLEIKQFLQGILLSRCSNIKILSNYIRANDDCGILLLDSSSNFIHENRITDNGDGITAIGSSNNDISENTIRANQKWWGVTLGNGSLYNSVHGNNIANNRGGIRIDGSNNTVYGNNITENEGTGIYLALGIVGGSPAKYNSITGNNITANKKNGIWLDMSAGYNNISRNNITRNYNNGIKLEESQGNIISENYITSNNNEGIWLTNSSSNMILGNNITANYNGIKLEESSNHNTISKNNITRNYYHGIFLSGSSEYNNISDNNIINNAIRGIELINASNNAISGNNIAKNDGGLYIYHGSSNNYIYHNNFIDNICQAMVSTESVNVWDNGYPSGGNYWSDYSGVDNFWGENQTSPGGDMLGDMPYTVNERNKDRYPLMKPGLTDRWEFEGCHVVAMSTSSIKDFSFNKKAGEISFNVAAGESDSCKIIISRWVLDGAFNLLIDDVPAAFSIRWSSNHHMINFTYSQGSHTIKIIGEFAGRPPLTDFPDINGDGKVNILDIYIVAKHFGKTLGQT
jgi:parallel beta-helix repeat protein